MHPTYVKLKLPEKVIRVLLLIMIFVQTCSCSNGACFGPVWKTKVYNEDTGYVGVEKKQVMINRKSNTSNYLYKISTFNSSTFYLFDETTRKFLCWKKSYKEMIAMDYRRINATNHWHFCKFRDIPSEKAPYVHLHLADRPDVRMRFDHKGKFPTPKRTKTCLEKKKTNPRIPMRHAKRCLGNNNFLVWSGDINCCRDAFKVFCNRKSQLRFMPELKKSCQDMRMMSKCY